MIQEAIERIRRMELYFDKLAKAAEESPDCFWRDETIKTMLRELIQYYDNGQWLRDYELDEKGLLPQNLKRGVLSEDAVYNWLSAIQAKNIIY